MPAQPARFPAPAAVDPWGSAGGQAACSSSAPRAPMLVRWDQKPEGNPNTQKGGKEEIQRRWKNIAWTNSVYGDKDFKEKQINILHYNQKLEQLPPQGKSTI